MLSDVYNRLVELAEKAGVAEKGKVKREILQAALWYEKNPKYARQLEDKLLKLAEAEPTPFPRPPQDRLAGPIGVGSNTWSGPVGLELDSIPHSLVVGRTQVGKSTTLGRLITKVDEKFDIPMIVIDPKRSLRGLIPSVKNLYPVRLDEIKFNPLSASFEGEKDQKHWIAQCWGIIARESDLLTGSLSFGLKIFDDLLEDFSSKEVPPTMFDLRSKIEERSVSIPQSSPKYRYVERISSRIDSLLYSFSDTFDCLQGLPVEEFLDPSSHILLETDGIEPGLSRTVVLLILQAIYHHNLIHGHRGKGVRLMVLIDEAEDFIGFESKYERSKKGTSFTSQLLERGREMGFALVMSVHHTKLTSAAFENLNTRVCMDLSSSDDVQKIASDMGLTEDQADVLEELEVGEAVMKVKGKWEEPFTVKIDPVPLDNVSDEEVEKHTKEFMERISSLVVPRKEKEGTGEDSSDQSEGEIGKDEHVLIENVAKFPYLSISERKDKLGWSNSKLQKLRKSLRSTGHIRKKRLKKGKGRGSTCTIIELTDKAIDYLDDQGIKANYLGRGGAVHSYWMQTFLDYFEEKNIDVNPEFDLNGVRVDLFVVRKSGETQAIEIEVSSADNTLKKIEKLLDRVDRVLIACDKKVLVEDFKDGIEGKPIDQERISIRKVQEIELGE